MSGPGHAPTGTLLIVEDEPDIASSLEDFFRRAELGVEVVTTGSALEADAVIASRRVDAVLADYRMPGENGVDFLARLHHRFPDLPLLLVTAFPDPHVLADAVNRAHVDGLLLKPLDEALLLQSVSDALRRHAARVDGIPSAPPVPRREP